MIRSGKVEYCGQKLRDGSVHQIIDRILTQYLWHRVIYRHLPSSDGGADQNKINKKPISLMFRRSHRSMIGSSLRKKRLRHTMRRNLGFVCVSACTMVPSIDVMVTIVKKTERTVIWPYILDCFHMYHHLIIAQTIINFMNDPWYTNHSNENKFFYWKASHSWIGFCISRL